MRKVDTESEMNKRRKDREENQFSKLLSEMRSRAQQKKKVVLLESSVIPPKQVFSY